MKKVYRLSMNENSLVPLKSTYIDVAKYPNELDCLKQKIAKFYRIKNNSVFITNGIDDAIFLFLSYLSSKKGKLLFSLPNYCGIIDAAKALDIEHLIYRQDDNEFDIDKLKQVLKNNKDIFGVYLCNPRNPYGTTIKVYDDIIGFLQKENILVFCDEAYAELAKLELNLERYESNLIVARTFSKAYGLAGIRCGYLLTNDKEFKDFLYKQEIAQPFKISSFSLKMALKALDNQQRLNRSINIINKKKKLVYDFFDNNNIIYYQSKTNFITFKFYKYNKLCLFMQKNGVEIKELSDFGATGLLRVSISSSKGIRLFLKLFRSFLLYDV